MSSSEYSLDQSDFGMAIAKGPGVSGWALWWRQFSAVLNAAITKSLFSKRVLVALLLIALPIGFLTVVGLIQNNEGMPFTRNINYARMIFGFVYSTFILGAVLYLGSALLFTSLLRGEILERSIHYSLLAPVRREMLVLGKFFGGLISATILFGVATIVCYLLIYLPYGSARLAADLSGGVAIGQIATYVLMTFLACLGYGSVFMAAGLLFRNPLIPVLVVGGWEFINFLLPPFLKMFSVIFYLKNLMPISINEGPLPLAVVASPISTGASIAGILSLALVFLGLSVLLIKRIQIKYTED